MLLNDSMKKNGNEYDIVPPKQASWPPDSELNIVIANQHTLMKPGFYMVRPKQVDGSTPAEWNVYHSSKAIFYMHSWKIEYEVVAIDINFRLMKREK